MKCGYCNGTGEHVNDANRMTTCEFCGGTGRIEVTNEEWFCGLDTEDKAREISDMTAQGYWSEELVERWLKEKHK